MSSVVGKRPVRAVSQRRLLPAAVSWVLFVYTAVSCIGVWSYAAVQVQSDYRSTLEVERERLRSESTTLEAQIESMLADGVGAAVAGANELEANGQDLGGISAERVGATLPRMLTGGRYVRSLFLATPARYVRYGRSGTTDSAAQPPAWLQPALALQSEDVWIGAPLTDPDRSGNAVVPIARRVGHGSARSAWAGALLDFGILLTVYQPAETFSGSGLFTYSGLTLLQIPAAPQNAGVGRNIGSSPLFQQAAHGPSTGVLEGVNPFTGNVSIVAYAHVEGYPMFVAASRRREAALASWYGRKRDTVIMTAALTALLIITTVMLNHFILALRRREEHYRALFNNAAFGAFVLDGDRFIEANRTSAQMFGVSAPAELMGLSPWDLSPTFQAEHEPSAVRAQERIREAMANGAVSFDWTHQRLDNGHTFTAAVDLASLNVSGRPLTLAVVHDTTERKRLDEERERALSELHELAGTLVRVQDDERRRIGRELHDTTGQTLAALEINLSRLTHEVEHGGITSDALLAESVTLAHQCSTEIRTASYLLHPPLLDDIGLLSALRWLADGLRNRSALQVELELPDSMERLPREQELALFRMAQEALTNVHRHAMSPTVSIRLREHNDSVVLEVEDEGRGLPRQRDAEPPPDFAALGVGLAGMRERMRQLGGTLTVRTGPDGTCVQARLPLVRTGSHRIYQHSA